MVKRWRPIILGVLTFVLAVSFRNDFLLFLFGFEVMLYIAALIQVRWIAKRLSMEIQLPRNTAFRNKPFTLKIKLTNSGIFPIPQLMTRAAVRAFPDHEELLLVGKTMLDSDEQGNVCFQMDSSHCGCLEVRCDRLMVMDYLGMVHSRCKVNRQEVHCFYILPEILSQDMDIPQVEGAFLSEDGELDRSGSTMLDSSEIREYHRGESLRHIHWKLSARMQRLLIREMMDNEQEKTWIYLNLLEPAGQNLRRDPDAWDHFVETVAGVSYTLVKMEIPHFVVWVDAIAKTAVRHDVSDSKTLEQMLCSLLRTDSFRSMESSHLLKEIHSNEAKTTRIEIDLQGNIRRSEEER